MCRLAAYLGPDIPLETLIVLPEHSLLQQSQGATEAKLAVNGDGFGIAWYGADKEPGQYRDVLPAWSDGNLTSICRLVRASLFLAHVRASTVGETSRVNCHPFTRGTWSFMHNGQIANFDRIRRALEATLPDDLYHARRGTTDSELLFLMTLSNGIEENPRMALQRTMAQIQSVQGPILQPNRVTCVLSDGVDIYAVRHSCDQRSPTLYVSETLYSGGQALASEPLDGIRENWRCIDDNQFVTLSRSGIKIDPFDVCASRTGNSPTGIRTIEPEICDSSAPGQCLNLA